MGLLERVALGVGRGGLVHEVLEILFPEFEAEFAVHYVAMATEYEVEIEFFRGVSLPSLEELLHDGLVVLAPIVAAELLSAPLSKSERRSLVSFLKDLPTHPTPLDHWLAVAQPRQHLLAAE